MLHVIDKANKNKQLYAALTMYERFQQNGDIERADKAALLLKKMVHKEFITAFSGHFSAGKSTMINELVGEQILPSSPIPTSANLVKVHEAEKDFAKVYYKNNKPLLFEAPYNFETVKEYCKSGDVVEIEIGKTRSKLPPGITIMDTPGVDSTDDAHRLSTESALHLADVVFYVMDYNHVQSELNFLYTRNLLEHGVKLFLIINQIDKHNEEELSFEGFKQSVEDSFAAWNVFPERIFYTTLKDPSHPHNEFASVKQLIHEAIANHEKWMEGTVRSAFHQMIEEHSRWLEEEKQERSKPLERKTGNLSSEEISQIYQKEEALQEKEEKLRNEAPQWISKLERERSELLKNAYLMPFETRQLAEKFLEAMQPDFKVGFFMSKKKTDTERAERLKNFSESLRKQVETQLEWHLRELFAKNLLDIHLMKNDLEHAAQQIQVSFEDGLLIDSIKKGARVTGEYVLNYCNDLADELKKIAVRQTDGLKKRIADELNARSQSELDRLQSELAEVREITHALDGLRRLEEEYAKKAELVHQSTGNEEETLKHLIKEWEYLEKEVSIYTGDPQQQPERQGHEIHYEEPISSVAKQVPPVKATTGLLDLAYSYLATENGFERIADQLKKKSERLKNREFTIALFGAFSAGKSSFANALLGEGVLPVSPNPTTAAINRICPPDEKNGHGTAIVRVKSVENMLADVNHSLQFFGRAADSLDEARQIIPSVTSENGDGKEKVHFSFLQAFRKGYGDFTGKFGQSLQTNLRDFQQYVAVESKSCFVESIDLYYDCSFTRMGVTLVDTPGADSINARHTGVAFEYIKDSDAILFVTYYNHAFSKADREFLIQLGRVKDAFELDKMFFIVNAIDLASTSEEVDDVIQYVGSQLTEFGIRFPRIFGVSSKLAQKCETRHESKVDVFLKAFTEFLENDLTKMAVQSAQSEYERAVKMLHQMIQSASEDEDQKRERKNRLLHSRDLLNKQLDETGTGPAPDRLSQEGKELVHYVKQRVFYRLPGFFKESFNPALLNQNNRDLLRKALKDYLETAGFDLAQELRATSLRLETFVVKLLKERHEQLKKEIRKVDENLTVPEPEFAKAPTMDFKPAFQGESDKKLETVFKYFKSPKAFFEKNEKKRMEEALEELLSPMADAYLAVNLEKLNDHFQSMLQQEFSNMLDSLREDLNEQYDAWLLAFEDSGKLSHWISIHEKLSAEIG